MERKFAASVWIWAADLGSDAAEDAALLEKISHLGFDGVEIPTLDGYLDPDGTQEILSTEGKKHRPLAPIIIGGGLAETDLSSESATIRSQGASYVRRLIDLSAELNGELVCGPLYSAVGAKRSLSERERSKVLDILTQEFKNLGKYARERSVRLALEPLCRYDTYLINTTAHLLSVWVILSAIFP